MSINRNPNGWTPGEIPAASKMNAEIRDLWTGLQATWVAYPFTWSSISSPQPAIGNGSLTGAFHQVGKTLLQRVILGIGSTTTFGTGAWVFGTSAAAAGSYSQIGSAMILDQSAGTVRAGWGAVWVAAYGGVLIYGPDGTALSGTTPVAMGAGDRITLDLAFELA